MIIVFFILALIFIGAWYFAKAKPSSSPKVYFLNAIRAYINLSLIAMLYLWLSIYPWIPWHNPKGEAFEQLLMIPLCLFLAVLGFSQLAHKKSLDLSFIKYLVPFIPMLIYIAQFFLGGIIPLAFVVIIHGIIVLVNLASND